MNRIIFELNVEKKEKTNYPQMDEKDFTLCAIRSKNNLNDNKLTYKYHCELATVYYTHLELKAHSSQMTSFAHRKNFFPT